MTLQGAKGGTRVPGHRTLLAGGAAAVLAICLGACSLPGGDPPSRTTSTGTGSDLSVTTMNPPREGRDWIVLVEDPTDTTRVAEDLEAADLELTSINPAVGMVTLRSTADDVAETATGIDGVAHAVTDQSIGWSPDEPAEPTGGDQTPVQDPLQPPAPPAGGDPFDGWLWGLAEIEATQAHEVTTGRRDVRVGVIDTGVDASHPDLADAYDHERSRTFVADIPALDGECEHKSCVDPVGTDGAGHGTHVAGTIAAAANGLGVRGVAPDVSIVDLRAGQDSGFFFLGPTVNALTQAADERLDVVNMSFYVDPWLYACPGGAPEDSPEQAQAQDVALELVHRAVELAHDRGVTLVTAVGNSGLDLADPGMDSTSPNFGADPHDRTIDAKTCEILPVDSPHVIGVASVDEGQTRSSFSNWTSDPSSDDVTVAAPGGSESDGTFGILSTAPRVELVTKGLVNTVGQVTVSGSRTGVVRDCPKGVAPGAKDPDEVCGYYQWLQGTSMATPYVSGVAALILSEHPDLGPDEVAAKLRSSAEDVACPDAGEGGADGDGPVCTGTTQRNGFFGDGIVDAAAAVR